MRAITVDLSLLDYCREDCGDPSLHAPHDGPRAACVTVRPKDEVVFVGPVAGYRCDDCGSETAAAVGRLRPHCGYCQAPYTRLRATGTAPGVAMCAGGFVDVTQTVQTTGRGSPKAVCPTCRRLVEIMRSGHPRPHRPQEESGIDPVLTDAVLDAVGWYVPMAFADLYDAVINTYGAKLSERTVQRAIALLVRTRQIAAIGDATWDAQRQRTAAVPGWYLRYDSPKLWTRGGLRDLMSVVAQADDDRAVTADSLRRCAVSNREHTLS